MVKKRKKEREKWWEVRYRKQIGQKKGKRQENMEKKK